jgi:hypothetical protein
MDLIASPFARFPLFLVASAGLAACTVEPLMRPEPPALDALLAMYEMPAGRLTQEEVTSVSSALRDPARWSKAADGLRYVLDQVLARVAPRPEVEKSSASLRIESAPAGSEGAMQDAGTPSSIRLKGDGFLRIRHICPGASPETAPDEQRDGVLRLTATFTSKGLDPVVWGEAIDCQLPLLADRLVLNGQLNLYIADLLQDVVSPQGPFVFSLSGSLHADDRQLVAAGLDFRICTSEAHACSPGRVEVPVRLAAGTIIFFFDPRTREIGFRTAEGLWQCRYDAECLVTCQHPDGRRITVPEICQ